ncbi:MAG: PilZ domain-containing protein [Acidimicrobiia bacterium]
MPATQTEQWRPTPGQIALIEPVGASPGRDCLTGVVVPDERIVVDLGASPRPDGDVTEVMASIFAPEALYRLTAKATLEPDGLLVLDVAGVEKVQRRNAPRARLALPVRMGMGERTPTTIVSGETIDLSTGGCRITTDRPWPDDSDPVLSIDLPDGGAVVTPARVITVDLSGDGWEYRLAYPTMTADDRERLSRLVALEG